MGFEGLDLYIIFSVTYWFTSTLQIKCIYSCLYKWHSQVLIHSHILAHDLAYFGIASDTSRHSVFH